MSRECAKYYGRQVPILWTVLIQSKQLNVVYICIWVAFRNCAYNCTTHSSRQTHTKVDYNVEKLPLASTQIEIYRREMFECLKLKAYTKITAAFLVN